LSDESTLTLEIAAVNDAPRVYLSDAATLVVNTLEDVENESDGVLSLREALALARDGDHIIFDASLFDEGLGEAAGVIALSGALQITSGVCINGEQGDSCITLKSDNYNSTLVVVQGVEGAVVSGLRIQGYAIDQNPLSIDPPDYPVLGGMSYITGL